uniref:Small multi-drug export protein n=2 Tax=Ananas comosus TaxID=4615 RepID=A0A6V7QF86_ANACO|nr:unnamed protein product [Ananas comosus var. bracteatus]
MASATFALSVAVITSPGSRKKTHSPSLCSTSPFPSSSCAPHFCLYSHSKLSFLCSKGSATVVSSTGPSPVLCSLSSASSTLALEAELEKPTSILAKRVLLCGSIWVALTCVSCIVCGPSRAADDAIKASGFGLKVAAALRSSGWADEAIVFTLATLPVLELRGAIPVGYWMRLNPVHLTVLSILGNMVPVPFIILYFKKFASFISQKSASATCFVDLLFERARAKAGPVEEFQWLGLMLFVAVPFPGTGAWTGAFIASILDMPFWSAVSANFVGVVLAGLLVNLLMNLGLKYATITGVILFFVSTVMWSVLRSLKKSTSAK